MNNTSKNKYHRGHKRNHTEGSFKGFSVLFALCMLAFSCFLGCEAESGLRTFCDHPDQWFAFQPLWQEK